MMMDDKDIINLQERTDSKLRYAAVHLKELEDYGILDRSDFDRAHQESFLFHLFGAKDSFLMELNNYYDINLPPKNVKAGQLRVALQKKGGKSDELSELYSLGKDKSSWYQQAEEMRHHSTHVSIVPRNYHLGGEYHQQVWLKVPGTDNIIAKHFIELYDEWLTDMTLLLKRLRESAINNRLRTT